MATNFSPSLGSYVLNKFPSISQWSDTGPSWPSCSGVGATFREYVFIWRNTVRVLIFTTEQYPTLVRESDSFHVKGHTVNSVSNLKSFDWSKLKPSANDNIVVAENMKVVIDRVERKMEKGVNGGNHNFSFPLDVFKSLQCC